MPESESPEQPLACAAEEDEDALTSDADLQELEDRLSGAVSDLNKRNRDVESYLDTLAQERRRELEGSAADQMTLDGIDPPETDDTPADA